jgi:type II secretory pathway pseudopilin PulG
MNNYEYIAELDAARNSQTALVITLAVLATVSTVAAIGFYISRNRIQKEFQVLQLSYYNEQLAKSNDREGDSENEKNQTNNS